MRTSLALLPLLLALAAPARGQDDGLTTPRVVIPWQDFKALYDKGQAPRDKPESAPRDYAISRAVYSGEVVEDATIFRATFRIDVLKREGWTSIPLLPTSVALRQARIGNDDAPIYLDGGYYRLITNKPGPVTINVEFAVDTWDTSGQQGFTFQLAPSGATEVHLTVPTSDDLDFQVANAQQLTEEVRGNSRTLHALLPSTGNLAVTWQRASTQSPEEITTPRIYAEHQSLVGVAEGLLQCRSTVHYSILQAGVEQLKLQLPADVTVLDVRGSGIREWSVVEQGPNDLITVDLNFEAKGAYTLDIEYEKPVAEGAAEVTVPELRILGADRVKGYVGIDARSNLEIEAGEISEARVVDVRELPAGILGQTDWPVLLGFKYNDQDYRIPLRIEQHEEVDMLVTIIDRAEATTVLTPDGRRMTQVTWSMRNNRAQFLRLDLPDGATPWSTFVGGRSVKPARGEDGRVLVPLARSQASGGELSRFAVEMVYVEDGDAAPDGGIVEFQGELPRADVPATAVAWTVYVPDGGKVKKRTIDGTLREVDWFTPIEVPGAGSEAAVREAQQQANAQFAGEAMAAGVQPVRVSLPIDGTPLYFEKLLVLDEELSVAFDYKYKP